MTLSNAAKAEYYGAVHDRIARGWTKRELVNNYGDVCLVGAIQDMVPWGAQHDLQVELAESIYQRDPFIKGMYGYGELGKRSSDGGLEVVERWNDRRWRRKAQVLRLLAEKRDHYAALAKKDYIDELHTRIRSLESSLRASRARVAELEARVNELTSEVNWWKMRARTKVVGALAQTNKYLEELDRELEDTHDQLLTATRE